MSRADLVLVSRKLASSRTHAQRLIAEGRVLLGTERRPILKASTSILETDAIEILPDEADRYVSRGGVKMAGALDRLGVSVQAFRVLDVGISTGGFTDCLLQRGARNVVGVDVGQGQLAEKLKNDPRVQCFEQMNARELTGELILKANQNELFDLIVCDVSFISLTLIIPNLLGLLTPHGKLLSLVKPQFEVGRGKLGGGGIVRDVELYKMVEEKIRQCVEASGFCVMDYFPSSIAGGDGNREFFVYAQPSAIPG